MGGERGSLTGHTYLSPPHSTLINGRFTSDSVPNQSDKSSTLITLNFSSPLREITKGSQSHT